jgi:phosphate-selective porin OprO and OprP
MLMRKNSLVLSLGLALAQAASHALAATPDPAARIFELEQRLQELDRKYQLLEQRIEQDQSAQAQRVAGAPLVSIGASGLTARSADTNFVMTLRALIQIDSRWFIDDGGIGNNDTFLVRRARPIIEGKVFRDFDFLFAPDFGGSATTLLDAHLNYQFNPALQFRVGKFKVPAGLELLQSDARGFFIERGFPRGLLPDRDVGFMVHGEVDKGLVGYAAGAFNGVGDGRSSGNIDFDDEKDVAARVFAHPFRSTGLEYLHGFGVGVGGTYGNREGFAGLPQAGGFATAGVQPFFAYRTGTGLDETGPNVIADGTHWRLVPQAYFYHGPFGLLGEYAISSQELRRDAGVRSFMTARNRAWQVAAGYVLTGENASYTGVTPNRPFQISDRGWGAWELLARYSYLDVDDAVFPQFADPVQAATRAASWSLGLNWYLNRNLRTSVNFVQTDFAGGEGAPVTRQTENAVLTRMQLAF